MLWGHLVVFGGWDSSARICNDCVMLCLDASGARWKRIYPTAGASGSPRSVYGAALTKVVTDRYGECGLLTGGLLYGNYRGEGVGEEGGREEGRTPMEWEKMERERER